MEWVAFHSLEPFGPQAANLNAGIVASIIANVNRKKDAAPFEPKQLSQGEFYEPEAEPQTVEEQKAAIERLVAAFGAKKKPKKDDAAKKKEIKKIG